MTFQDFINCLQTYWAEQGCVLVQPLDMEVGAGTFHPATFLRSIGPEPWNSRSRGTRLMCSHAGDPRMAVMEKTRTACNTTTNIRLS